MLPRIDRLIEQKRYKLKGEDITIGNNDYVKCPGRSEPGLFMGRNENGTMKVRFVGAVADENVPWESCSKVSSKERKKIIKLEGEAELAVPVDAVRNSRFDLIKSFYAPNIVGGIIPVGTIGTGRISMPIVNIATTLGDAVFTLTCSPDPRISSDIKNAFNDAINDDKVDLAADNVDLARKIANEYPMVCYDVLRYVYNENEQEINKFLNELVIYFESIASLGLYVVGGANEGLLEADPMSAAYNSITRATEQLLETHSPPVPEGILLNEESVNLRIALGAAIIVGETPPEIIRIRERIEVNNPRQLMAEIRRVLTAEEARVMAQLAAVGNTFTMRELLDYNDAISRALTIYNDTTRAALDTLQNALFHPPLVRANEIGGPVYNRMIDRANRASTAVVAMRESIKAKKAFVNDFYKYGVISGIYRELPIILRDLCEYIYGLENPVPPVQPPLNYINMNKAILIEPARNNVENYIMSEHFISDDGINTCIYDVDNFISLRAQLERLSALSSASFSPNERALQEAAIAGALESAPDAQLNILRDNLPGVVVGNPLYQLLINFTALRQILLNNVPNDPGLQPAKTGLADALSAILLEIPIIQIAPAALITTIVQAREPQIAALAAAIPPVVTAALAIPIPGVTALTPDQIVALNAAAVDRKELTRKQATEMSSALVSALREAARLPPIIAGGLVVGPAPAPAKTALRLALRAALAPAEAKQLISLSASVIAARIMLLTNAELQHIIGVLPAGLPAPNPLPESIIRIKNPRPIIDPITGEPIPTAVQLTPLGKRKLISLIVMCQPNIRDGFNKLLEADLTPNASPGTLLQLTNNVILHGINGFINNRFPDQVNGKKTRAEIFENMYNGEDLYNLYEIKNKSEKNKSAVIKLSKEIIQFRIYQWLTTDANFQLPHSFILNEHGSNYEEQLGRNDDICTTISGYSSEPDPALNEETQKFNEAFGKQGDNTGTEEVEKEKKKYEKISGPNIIREDLAERRRLLMDTKQKLSLTPKINKLLNLNSKEDKDNVSPEVKAALAKDAAKAEDEGKVRGGNSKSLKRSKIKHNNNKSRRKK